MKRRHKKLRLNKETVRSLSNSGLRIAVGGGDTHEFETGCACTDGCGGTGGGGGGSNGCPNTNTCTCIEPQSYCWCP